MLVIALLDTCPEVQAPPRDVILSSPIVARLEVVSAIEGELPHILAHGITPRTAAGAIADMVIHFAIVNQRPFPEILAPPILLVGLRPGGLCDRRLFGKEMID